MARTALKINGRQHVVDVDPDCPLLYVLRDTLALNNPRFGCGSDSGACTVPSTPRGPVVHAARIARGRTRDRHH
jgi:aerobic-type carbon monoxide dehydrogenase small subunit (CoxS/CutS family)